MQTLAEEIIKDLEPYFSSKWSLLEICILEAAKISSKVEKANAQNNANAFQWILSMIHARQSNSKEDDVKKCQDVICKSIVDYIREA